MKRFKKLLSLVLAVGMMCAVSVTAWADIAPICGHSEHDSCTEIDISDQYMQIIQADLSNSGLSIPTAYGVVSCIHKWTNWKLLDDWLEENLDDFDACVIYVKEEYRYCQECGEMKAQKTRTQLSHRWVGTAQRKECTNCGDVRELIR